jgi:putative DNA primase/helicase
MFAPLAAYEIEAAAHDAPRRHKAAKVPILPVPDDAPPLAFRHPEWGPPVAVWPYHDGAGDLLGYAARFDTGDGGKEFLPLTFCDIGNGRRAWRSAGLPKPRPLYRWPDLLARPDAPVVVCEGEKAADAAALAFPDAIATTPMHGAKSPQTADWSALAGRHVTVWPDHDEAGAAFAGQVAALAMEAGAASVCVVQVPEAFPPKWDLADPAPKGADLAALLVGAPPWDPPADDDDGPPEDDEGPRRPGFATYDEWTAFGRPGLYYHGWGPAKKNEPPEPVDTWICAPLWADAMTEGADGRSHGLLLRFLDPKGREKQWAAPLSLLAGDGSDLRRELWDQGLRLDVQAGRTLLPRWLANSYPKRTTLAATRCGWLPDLSAYVMPGETIGAADAVWQGDAAPAVATGGTLGGWRDTVAAPASGNPLAVLALSAAFAGPLLARVQRMGAGLHFMGDSSTGKSTLLAMASSVWGRPDDFIRTWRATGNGLESVAAAHNDGLLALDEISECDPREVGAIVYALANGTGKTRAARTGGTRPVYRWRVVLVSSGERSVAASMAEGGRIQKAGQTVRVLDIPCHRSHGVFDALGAAPDGRTLADALKRASAMHYGQAGPAFIRALLDDGQDLGALLAEAGQDPAFRGAGELEGRAASALALVGMAGELARDYGLVPWPEGEALEAAALAFGLWRDGRDTGRPEDGQILDAVRDFLLRHGDARFSSLDADGGAMVRDRAGWWREADAGRVYMLTPGAMREAIGGHDLPRALDALDRAGWIVDRDHGKRSKKAKVQGRAQNLYAIAPGGADHAAR